MRSIRSIVLAAVVATAAQSTVLAPHRALAQETAPAAASSADPSSGPPLSAAPAVQGGDTHGLPVQSGPPRTLRAYWHVFIAFTIAWLLVFGYALSLGARFRRLERDVEALRGAS